MSKTVPIAAMIIVAIPSACKEDQRRKVEIARKKSAPARQAMDTTSPAEIYLAGIVVKSHLPDGQPRWISLVPPSKGDYDGIPLQANLPIVTGAVDRIVVKQTLPNGAIESTFLAGPYWGREDVAECTVKNPVAHAQIGPGWIYIVGEWPLSTTKRVAAGTIQSPAGTILPAAVVMQVSPDHPDTERVYLCSGQLESVKVISNPGETQPLSTIKHYVELYKDPASGKYKLKPARDIANAPEEFKEFIKHVAGIASIAGMPPVPTPSP
jgi:hypothetical protein